MSTEQRVTIDLTLSQAVETELDLTAWLETSGGRGTRRQRDDMARTRNKLRKAIARARGGAS